MRTEIILVSVPYDAKLLTLSSTRGSPTTIYINASEITFPGCRQAFIAAQAPKENTIENFWQMIIEKKVKKYFYFLYFFILQCSLCRLG